MLKQQPMKSMGRAPAVPAPAMRPGVRHPAGAVPRAAAGPMPRLERSGIAHYLMLLYVFLYCSRLQEFVPRARLSAVLLLVLVAFMAATLRGAAIVRIPSGKTLIGFTAWVGICVPTAVWVGGSAGVFRGSIQSLLIVMLMAAYIETVREALRAMYAVGMAMALAASMSFVAGTEQSNRLVLGEGTLGDPNYYCYYVLAGLPFLWLAVYIESGFRRAIALIGMLPVLIVIARTGSRMGLLAFAAGLLFLFWFSPFKQKIYLTLAAVSMVIVATVALPPEIISRFTTIFVADPGAKDTEMAADSAKARRYLFFRSLELTAKNPIVGVGPGMFVYGENEDAKETGTKGAWHVSHNTYTQYSSEIGIPGALLFLSALFTAYRGLTRIRKSDSDTRMKQAAMFTQMSIVMVSVAAAFLSLGYGGLSYVLIALSGSFQVAMAKQTAAMAAARRPS
jgi:O-antigen ligase